MNVTTGRPNVGLVSLTFVTMVAKRVELVHWLPIRLSLHYNPEFVTIAALNEGQLRMELTWVSEVVVTIDRPNAVLLNPEVVAISLV